MGTWSLQSDSNPRRRRSFTLSSFRKTPPAESQQGLATSASAAAQEAERVRKAAAWQWYTRGVGEVVVPTKRPAAADGGAPASTAVKDTSGRPILVGGPKPSVQESRFKVEASTRGSAPPTTASANPAIAAPSPLYDEVELSALTTQMADFVQRMQQKQQSQPEAVMPPAPAEAPQRPPPPPPPPFPPEAETAGIRRSISSSARVSGFRRPISALHRFLRQLISGSTYKSSSAAATLKEPNDEGNLGPEPAADDVEYHYHHYIHHHHHHYHYGHSPEEAELNSRRRRYSESSGIRPRIPASIWEENEEDVNDNEKSPSIIAFLSRRRRHSDSAFAEVRKVGSMADDGGKVDVKQAMDEAARPAKPAAEPQPPARRFSSERFTRGNKVPKEWKDEGQGGWRSGADVRSRRRHSAEGAANYGWWSGGEVAMEGRSRAASGGGMGGGVYKLSGVDTNHIERKPVGGRRAFRQESRRSCS